MHVDPKGSEDLYDWYNDEGKTMIFEEAAALEKSAEKRNLSEVCSYPLKEAVCSDARNLSSLPGRLQQCG